MKIGFDAKRYFHNHTGLGNYSRTLVAGLQRFCMADVECQLYDEKSLTRTFGLGRKALADGCQLLHGLSNELPMDSLRAGIPTIVTMHDTAWLSFPEMFHWIDRKIYTAKYGWAARHATRVIAISESTKRDLMRYYGIGEERITVIYQPVQERFYTPIDGALANEIVRRTFPQLPAEFALYVGSINSRKNLLSAVRAIGALANEKRIPLAIVGNGHEYRREVERYIGQNGLEKWFYFLDSVRDDNVLQCLYTAAKFFIYPSYYEGFGLPVVEASLQACPVITSTVSSLPEAAGDSALLVNPASVDEIRDAIETLLDKPEVAKSIGQKGQNYAQTMFSPSVQPKKLCELYRELITGN